MALKAVRPALTHWRHSNALVPIRAECIPRYAFMPALLSEILPFSPAMPLSVRNNAQEGTLLGLDSTQPYLGYWDTTYLLQACIHAILNNNECPEPPHPLPPIMDSTLYAFLIFTWNWIQCIYVHSIMWAAMRQWRCREPLRAESGRNATRRSNQIGLSWKGLWASKGTSDGKLNELVLFVNFIPTS